MEGNGIPFPFIQRSYEEKEIITAGCGINLLVYCPDELVTRGQMASFIMRALFNETSTGSDGTDAHGSQSEYDGYDRRC